MNLSGGPACGWPGLWIPSGQEHSAIPELQGVGEGWPLNKLPCSLSRRAVAAGESLASRWGLPLGRLMRCAHGGGVLTSDSSRDPSWSVAVGRRCDVGRSVRELSLAGVPEPCLAGRSGAACLRQAGREAGGAPLPLCLVFAAVRLFLQTHQPGGA